MEKLKTISEIKHKLIDALKSETDKGLECLDAKELGEVTDMIKDLAEAEEKCLKALYYETVVDAMTEGEDGTSRAGYDHWRYSSGRYAPKGKGHYSGYHHMPTMDKMDVEMYEPGLLEKMRMGYTTSMTHRGDNGTGDGRYGKAFNDYKEARRHYSKTHSPSDKEDMDHHANTHIMDTITTLREIYQNADPDLRRRMKADCEKLVDDMKD